MSLYQLADPNNLFKVVLADPAWPSAKRKPKAGTWLSKRTRPSYGTMKAADILALPVSDIAAEDAMLVLWATWMHMPLAMQCIQQWGFTYATGFPWLKVTKSSVEYSKSNYLPRPYIEPIFGPGVWVQHCTELILLARRGRPFGAQGNPRPARKGIIISPRQEHSRKPDELHQWIEAKFPTPRIELFARRPREGWTVWGNEVNG